MAPHSSVKDGYKADGTWQCYVVDASNAISSFDGKKLQYFRFDFMNNDAGITQDAYVDIAFIGLFSTEEDAMRFAFPEAYMSPEEKKAALIEKYIDPSSGYSGSDRVYGCSLDFINGKPAGAEHGGGNSKYGASVIDGATLSVKDGGITFAGWAVVDGGISKYVWSADHGRTWHGMTNNKIGGVGNGAGDAHYHVVSLTIGAHTFSAGSNLLTTFQHNEGGGLMANLGAYRGETVDVVFAAVPKKDPDALCLLAVVTDVKVPG